MIKCVIPSFIIIIVLFSACSNHFYGPALYNNSASYQAKPLSSDEKRSANYVSGGFFLGTGIDGTNDISATGQLSINRSQTFDFVNIAYGAFGFAGNYQNTYVSENDPDYFDSKSIYGYGGNASVSFYYPVNDKVDFRFAGVEFDYSKEFGGFSNYRNTIQNNPYSFVDVNNTVVFGALTSELAWRGNNANLKHAIRVFYGNNFGYHDYVNNTTYQHNVTRNLGASFYMQVKNCFFTFERQYALNWGIKFGYQF